ncbi:hypothetical protein BH10ACI1_BH10ACI1_25540 [soil metagenome]
MKTLFILVSMMVILFLAASNKVEAQGEAFFDCLRKGRDFRAGGIKIVSVKLKRKGDFKYPQIASPRTPHERKFNAEVLKIVRRGGVDGFSVLYATPEFVSVQLLLVEVCGASCHGGIEPVNFDLKTGKQINNLSELFESKSDYLKAISSYALGEFRRCGWGEEDDWFKEGTEPTADNYKTWNLTRDGIEITFPEYQIAPGVFPGVGVLVPYTHLNRILRTDVDWFSLPQQSNLIVSAQQTNSLETGSYAIKPQFDWARSFSEGLAIVEMKGKSGCIDKTGKMVVTPRFDGTGWLFSEGFVAVIVGDLMTDKWGYIDKTGKLVISRQFDQAESFSDGLAPVRVGDDANGKWGYVDKTGKMVIPLRFDDTYGFSDGLAPVRIGDDATGKWGYIDKTGKLVIPLQFDGASIFSEGIAAVRIGVYPRGKWGYIDKSGKMVITPQFGLTQGFSEGLAVVGTGDTATDKFGYIDKTGKIIIPLEFPLVSEFSEGLAQLQIGEGDTRKWAFIDKSGKVVIPPFFQTSQFSEGLAAVRVRDSLMGKLKWGYIDKTGKMVIKPQFDSAGGFSDGLAPVLDFKTGKWGYIYR